jgi:hypothetical protein
MAEKPTILVGDLIQPCPSTAATGLPRGSDFEHRSVWIFSKPEIADFVASRPDVLGPTRERWLTERLAGQIIRFGWILPTLEAEVSERERDYVPSGLAGSTMSAPAFPEHHPVSTE